MYGSLNMYAHIGRIEQRVGESGGGGLALAGAHVIMLDLAIRELNQYLWLRARLRRGRRLHR